MQSTPAAGGGNGTALARGVASGARLRSTPLVFSSAHGATVQTVDGVSLTDFMLGMGPMLLGHGRPEVLDAVRAQLPKGVLYGTTPLELRLADELARLLPFVDKVAFVNSGSEGTHLAVRIARATTGRRLIVKFEGQYHGWLEPLFLNTQNNDPTGVAGAPVPPIHAVEGQPTSDEVVVIRWNDLDALESLFAQRGAEIAGVILEPLPMNFGAMLPDDGYMARMRELCFRDGALLIFDEVLSGFRVGITGAAGLLGVWPDLAVYAKAIANGFPLAAVAGSDAAMASIVDGPVQPAGTYSGNPVVGAAALATLGILEAEGETLYAELDRLGRRLRDGIREQSASQGGALEANQIGSVLQLFWGTGPVRSFDDAARSDRAVIARISEAQERYGSLVSPRGLILLSAAHTDADIDRLIEGIGRAMDEEI